MKVLGVFVLILSLSLFISFIMDALLGFNFSHAVSHLFNPFWVIETGEFMLLLFFLLLTIGQQIVFIIKNKANKQKGVS